MTVDPAFQSPAVEHRFAEFSEPMRDALLALRSLIFRTAADNADAGSIVETLKWNEPAYLSPHGTTIRINAHRQSEIEYGLYVHCRTNLLERYRTLYSDTLRFDGNRAILFAIDEPLPDEILRHCVTMALLYHHD